MVRSRVLVTGVVIALGVPAAVSAAPPTFNKDVAPIFNKSCVACHRPGEAAPMSLVGYDNVRPWARSIRQKVSRREMPPWSADPKASVKFRNDPTLTQAEIDTVVAWVDADAPRGSEAEPAAPAFVDGWNDPSGRNPDYVLTLPAVYEVPATNEGGGASKMNPVFYIKIPFDTDKWFRAVHARPDKRSNVLYMDLNIVEFPEGVSPPVPGAVRVPGAPRVLPQELAFLTGNFRPGAGYEAFPAQVGKRIPGGGNRYFEITMHYAPNGTIQQDRSSFGFWWTATEPRREVVRVPMTGGVVMAAGQEVFNAATAKPGPTLTTKVYYPTVPANTARFEVTSVHPFSVPVTIYELMPHAHNRAVDFKYTLVRPDGREQVLLTVPRYNEGMQSGYELAEPIDIPAGSKMVIVAHYDNSVSNKTVAASDRPGSDMFMPTMQYATDNLSKPAGRTPQQ